VQVAVVGAGISGLVAAWSLCRDAPSVRVSVLEAGPVVGGRLALGDLGGHAVDAGADAVAATPAVQALLADLGLADRVVAPARVGTNVALQGRLVALPVGTVGGVPGDADALARSGLLSRRGLARARLDAVLPVRQATGDIGVGRYVTARLGREVTDRLVAPLLAERYAGAVDQLSLGALLPDLASARDRGERPSEAARRLARSPEAAADGWPKRLSLVDGLGRLPAALAAAAESAGVRVRTRATVRAIAPGPGGGWRLELGPVPRPEQLDVDAVVLAVPAATAARLLRPVVPVAAGLLDTVAGASVAVVPLAYRRKDVPAGSLTGGGHVVAHVPGGPVRAVTYASHRWAWLGSALPDLLLLRVSLGRADEQALLQREDADLVDLAAAHVTDTLGVGARPAAGAVFRWGGAVPQYPVGHPARARRVHELLVDQRGLVVCGAALDGDGIEACVASARAAAARLVASREGGSPLP
jgi:oxygen-dependent protoporphyrinogen oxidase